ncbi:MAG: patatin-like phospholipase family protein [Bacteroidota bacterium]
MPTKNIHLVCASGGVKTLSYIGAIRELLKNGFTISSISSCSMGTLIAALVCYGMDIDEIEEKLVNFDFKTVIKKKSFSKMRLLYYPFASHETPDYQRLIRSIIGKDITLGEMKIPFSTFALDLKQKKFLVYSSEHHSDMPLWQVIRIATAIPMFFEPYSLNKRVLVDAAVASESPVWIAASRPGRYPIVVLKPLAPPDFNYKKSFGEFLSLLISSSSISHDFFVATQTSRTINLDINCEAMSTRNFGITSEQIENLILQGQNAAQKKLAEFDNDFNRVLKEDGLIDVKRGGSSEDKAELLANQMITDFHNEVAMRDQIFVSYSHNDRDWMNRLKVYLKSLERFMGIKAWDDTSIQPGSEWNTEINKALVASKIAIFLVTPDFLASDFIQDQEMKYFLELSEKEKVPIFWIAVSSSLYEVTPLAQLQCANDPAKPLDTLTEAEQNIELTNICKKIVERMK